MGFLAQLLLPAFAVSSDIVNLNNEVTTWPVE